MQQVRPAGLKDIEESPQKKVSLLSEWTLPHAAEVLQRSRQKPQVDTIGYGSISAFESADETVVPQGRKVWGKPDESIRHIDIGRIKDSIIDEKAEKAEKAGKAGKAGQEDEENADDDDSGDDAGDNAKNGSAHGKAKKQKGKRKASSGRKSNKKQKK